MLRWTIRILIVFVVLVVVSAAVVHFVLQSRWLSDLILARVADTIGMDVTADSISVGWGGRTTIRGATVSMPLTGDVVLAAERIDVAHEAIPLLILGRPVNVRSVQVETPQVNLRQYEDGRWNAEDVWARVRARRKPPAKKRIIPLPEVVIQDAQVHITEPNGVAQVIGPASFHARLQGRQLWQFDLEIPEMVGVQGRVAEGRDWAHEAEFHVAGIDSLVGRLVGNSLTPIRATGRWEGRVLQDSLEGIVRLDALVIGSVAARGDIGVQARSGELSVTPKDLVISEPNALERAIRLTGGSVRVLGTQIRLEQLTAASSRLAAQVNGSWSLDARSGEFTGSWATIADGQDAQYNGTYRAQAASPRLGRKAARMSIRGGAEDSFGELAVVADIEGGGSDWKQSLWQLSAPTLHWSRQGKEVNLAGAGAEIRVAWPEVRLTDLRMPDANAIDANALFDASTRRWSVRLAAKDVTHLAPWNVKSLDLRLNAEGDDSGAYVSELQVVEGERVATAKGRLSFRERGFQDVRLIADWPTRQSEIQAQVGHWHLEGDIFGRVQPLAIEMSGRMIGQNVFLGKQSVDRVEIPIRAKVDAEAVQMTTDPVDMFGGRWQLSGRHDWSGHVTQIAATADALSLESVAAMAGLKLVSRGQAHAQIDVAVQNFDINSAVATGSWDAEDVNIPPFVAERAHGKLRIAGGVVRFDDILLERENGQAEAGVEFRLDDPRFLSVELTSKQWPIQFERNSLLLHADGRAKLQIDLANRTAEGEARLSGRVWLKDQELARIRAVARAQEKMLNLDELYAETLGGTVEGEAEVHLDHWDRSSGRLRWQGIQPKMLQAWAPQFERFAGTLSGSLEASQAAASFRPPEPLQFALNANVEKGRFGAAAVNSCRVSGFLGDTRLLIDEADLRVLDGQVKARVRVSTHAGTQYGSIATDINNLSLDQIVHVADPKAETHTGYLSGTVMLLGSSAVLAKDFSPLQGEARIVLTKSELGNNDIIRSLYNTMNLQFGPQEPNGSGDATLR
ncbi:MAG: hypothetical protein ACM3VT_20810, partial [Solirubrobacterales bacterium]